MRRRCSRGSSRAFDNQLLTNLQKVACLEMIELHKLVYRNAVSKRDAEQRIVLLHNVN